MTTEIKTTKVPILELVKKLQAVEQHLSTVVFERESEINGMLLAVLTKTSCFFYGEVGTAKTFLIRSMSQLLGLSTFDILLSETTKVDAIFGPLDVPALAKGIQRTKIDGYAPSCEILFFDEIFKANATVLNPLLWLTNEHVYRNGDDGIIQCPVRATFAASNEIPDDDALKAIYDRLLLRYEIGYIRSRPNLIKMVETNLAGKDTEEPPQALTIAELDRLTKAVKRVKVPHTIMETVFKIRDQVQAAVGTSISDRRVARAFRIMQAHALLQARAEVGPADVEVLAHLFWERPEHHSKVASIVLANADSGIADLLSLSMLASDVWDTALKTGDFPGAVTKLESLYSKVSNYQTGRGKKIADEIKDKLDRATGIIESRKNFILIRMRLNTGIQYKVQSATALLWSPKELRTADMHHFRAGDYWYHYGPKRIADRKVYEKNMKRKIANALGVSVSIRKL